MRGTIKLRRISRLKFYKAITASMLMYGSGNLALNRPERRLLRFVPGYALIDHVHYSYKAVRNALQIYAEEETILVGKPEGKRPLGKPRHRWLDNVKMDLRKIG
jgi:hypothetical protein